MFNVYIHLYHDGYMKIIHYICILAIVVPLLLNRLQNKTLNTKFHRDTNPNAEYNTEKKILLLSNVLVFKPYTKTKRIRIVAVRYRRTVSTLISFQMSVYKYQGETVSIKQSSTVEKAFLLFFQCKCITSKFVFNNFTSKCN